MSNITEVDSNVPNLSGVGFVPSDDRITNVTQDNQITLEDYLRHLNQHPIPEVNEAQENVDHPAHYNSDKYECIEVMREIFGDEAVKTWIRLNIFKYSWRSDKKNGDEDIAKIAWYANYYDKIK